MGLGCVVGDAMLRLEPSRSISRTPTDQWEGTTGYARTGCGGRGLAAETATELLAIGFDDLGLAGLRPTRMPTTSLTGFSGASGCGTRPR